MTDDHDRCGDDVAAYVLGALTEIEVAAVERHLQECDSCSRDLQRFRAVVEALSVTAAPRRAREDLKQEVLQRIREAETAGQPRRSSRRRLLDRMAHRRPTLALAGALGSIVLVVAGYGVGATIAGQERQVLSGSVDRTRAPGARATLERDGEVGVLRVSNLAPLDDGVYVVWIDRGSGPTYDSSFNVSSAGTAAAGVSGLDTVERVMVTTEAMAPVSRPTSRPILSVLVQ